jgi:hypothetical protein
MNNELGMMWKKSVVICFKFESPKGLKITTKNMKVSDLQDLPDTKYVVVIFTPS